MTMITPSYLGETIEYSSLHACRSTLEDPTIEQLQAGRTDVDITVHEHINNYCLLSVQKLIEAAGLHIVSIDAAPVQTPMANQTFIRALAKL